MKLAIIGSRNLSPLIIDAYIPANVTEIVSGGASGVDALAKDFANRKGIKLTEFLPQYHLYGRAAPIKRNREIAEYADEAIAFWDGKSKGTDYTIKLFQKLEKKILVVRKS
ncbi:MAG: DUF2493 domain-containing protein [Ruminococcaceae bacterium]|nr:DUF2493 domain-containing protein [Oscillospiraceae bacterium]